MDEARGSRISLQLSALRKTIGCIFKLLREKMPEDKKYVCTLSPELQKQALDELGEDPQRREQDIETIRKWLKKQPHINARMDDWTILRFLRGCKFSLERTKEKLDMFYTCKGAIPEWFTNRDPRNAKLKDLLEMGKSLPLPGYDELGRKVVLIRPNLHDPLKYSLDEVTKTSFMIMDLCCEEDEQLSITGFVLVMDFSGMTPNHILAMSPSLAKKSTTVWQDGYPMRLKAQHFINTPPAFDTVLNIFKSFMKEKLKKRLRFHGSDLSSLHKDVPVSILPKEYGGTNGTVDEITKYWVDKANDRRDWLIDEEKLKVDESKRPGKPKTSSDLFGLEGSFRKLNVD